MFLPEKNLPRRKMPTRTTLLGNRKRMGSEFLQALQVLLTQFRLFGSFSRKNAPSKMHSILCFPKRPLKECTSSKKECTPSSPSLPQKQEECLFPPPLQKKREKSANTPPFPPPPPLTEGSAPTPERRDCTHPWKEGSLPAHHPTVAWFVRHCAWLHDRFVMKRQDEPTLFQTSSPFFETVPWREPGLHVFNFKRKWGVGIWAGRDNLAVMHIILTRQGASSARSIRRLAPSEEADQQLLLTAKGHPGRLKAMTDEQKCWFYHQHKVRRPSVRDRSSAGYSRTSICNASRRSGREL